MQLQEHIARFFTGQTGPDERLSHFGDWWKTRPGFGEDTLPNNVDIRSYLLERRFAKDGTEILQLRLDAIRSLYTHLQTEGHIQKSPFDGGAFPQLLASAERKRRSSVFKGDDAEIVRLKALNTLADRVNQASNVASVLQNALEILVEVMNLETAWAFLRSDLDPFSENDNPHGYTLAAKSALPPGLQADDCRFLCKAPACYCQNLLNAGRLSRAVNVVECSRLMDAARSEGDTKGLRFHATVPLLGAEGTHGLINIATDSWEILDAADLQLLTTAGAYPSSATTGCPTRSGGPSRWLNYGAAHVPLGLIWPNTRMHPFPTSGNSPKKRWSITLITTSSESSPSPRKQAWSSRSIPTTHPYPLLAASGAFSGTSSNSSGVSINSTALTTNSISVWDAGRR